MELNVQKLNASYVRMWFNVNSFKSFEAFPILLNGSPLSQVAKHKYLGVLIDEHLWWSSHVSYLWDIICIYLATTITFCQCLF